ERERVRVLDVAGRTRPLHRQVNGAPLDRPRATFQPHRRATRQQDDGERQNGGGWTGQRRHVGILSPHIPRPGGGGMTTRRFPWLALVIGLSLVAPPRAVAFDVFRYEEATIADIHAAFKAKTLTCRALVQSYLDRIEAYDKKGPALNAIVMTN